MHFEPSGELKEFINNCVKSGNYASQAEVMRAALRRLKREYEERRNHRNEPNAETIAAFKEAEEGRATTLSVDNFMKEMAALKND
jgi:putative addiction module CopG family antidote